MRIKTFGIIVLSILFPFSASAFDVSVTPQVIKQGDAFLVEVASEINSVPSGNIGKKKLHFHRTSHGTFRALGFMGLEEPSDTYTITLQQGTLSRITDIRVLPLKATTINISVPENKVSLSPKNERRAVRESALLKKRWTKKTERKWNGPFYAPLDTEVSTKFGVVRLFNRHKRSVHKGVDYRGKRGSPIRSINAGNVVLTDDQFFGGNTVMIDHGEGIFSIYMHLDRILVEEGQEVSQDEAIGNVGSSGRATGPHLHMSLKWNGLTVNPLSLFDLPL